MAELNLKNKFQQLSTRLLRILKLEKIDQHESLTFLHKNYKIHPSEVITLATLLVILVILILDGFNIIASVVCFLYPLFKCLESLAA